MFSLTVIVVLVFAYAHNLISYSWALYLPPTEELYQLFGQAFYFSIVIKDRNIQHVAVLH